MTIGTSDMKVSTAPRLFDAEEKNACVAERIIADGWHSNGLADLAIFRVACLPTGDAALCFESALGAMSAVIQRIAAEMTES